MKQVENREYEQELLEELELPAVPKLIDDRLRQVYAELPEQVPVKRRAPVRALKTAIGTVSGLAAAFMLLLGINGLNPALAESLPLVGGIFQQINNTQGWVNLTETQLDVQRYAQPVENVEAQVPANGLLEKPMTVTVREAYFDGEFLYAGLELELDCRESELLTNQVPGYNILINGEEQLGYNEKGGRGRDAEGFVMMSHDGWQRMENGQYLSQLAFRVPEQYRALEQVQVTLQYVGIYHQGDWTNQVLNSTPFKLDFTAEKNDAQVKRIEGGAERNGVKLVSAVASPAGTVFTLDIPSEYVNPSGGAIFEDGCAVGALGDASPQTTEEGLTRVTRVFGGLREEETRKIVYSVFDKNGTDEYVAVFLLDFEAGTAELGTEEDIKQFTPAAYYCEEKEIQSFPGDHKISLASHKEAGNYLLLFVETKDQHPRKVQVEVWQEDVLLGSRVEEQDKRFYEGYQYVNAEGNTVKTETNRYMFGLIGMEVLDSAKPVTVKLYDVDSNELMMEETITLTPEEE